MGMILDRSSCKENLGNYHRGIKKKDIFGIEYPFTTDLKNSNSSQLYTSDRRSSRITFLLCITMLREIWGCITEFSSENDFGVALRMHSVTVSNAVLIIPRSPILFALWHLCLKSFKREWGLSELGWGKGGGEVSTCQGM